MACVDVLLKNKADIDLPDPDGVSPLLVAIMNANWDLAKQLIEAGADVNQWDIYGETPLFTAIDLRTRIDGGRGVHRSAEHDQRASRSSSCCSTAAPTRTCSCSSSRRTCAGATNTRGATPLIRAANNGDVEMVKLLLENGADATIYMADRQTPIHAVLAGRCAGAAGDRTDRVLQKAGTDVNVVALINHREEIRGGTALHYAVRKRQKEVIKLLASLGIDMNAVDQDGLTALDYTQSRGFMPFMALQTPLFKEEAQLLRELGATKLMAQSPVWPVLGPPQGVWDDIWPLGESRVHEPVYKPDDHQWTLGRSTSRTPTVRLQTGPNLRQLVAGRTLFCQPRAASMLVGAAASAVRFSPRLSRPRSARITTTDLGGATLFQGAGGNVIALPGS